MIGIIIVIVFTILLFHVMWAAVELELMIHFYIRLSYRIMRYLFCLTPLLPKHMVPRLRKFSREEAYRDIKAAQKHIHKNVYYDSYKDKYVY